MDFTAKLLVERTQLGLRASVKEQGKQFNVLIGFIAYHDLNFTPLYLLCQ